MTLRTHKLSVDGHPRLRLVDVDIALSAGEVIVLVGENGAGKTTLLRTLCGLQQPTSGTVHLDKVDLHALPPAEQARQLSSMPQHDRAPDAMSVARRVLQGAVPAVGTERLFDDRQHQLLDDVLDELDLQAFRDRPLRDLSGGERRRAHVARCLAHPSATAYLLDEPFAGVDRSHARVVLQALRRRAAQGALVVVSVHDLDLAVLLADRVIGLRHGRVVVEGAPAVALDTEGLQLIFDQEGKLVDDDGHVGVLFKRS